MSSRMKLRAWYLHVNSHRGSDGRKTGDQETRRNPVFNRENLTSARMRRWGREGRVVAILDPRSRIGSVSSSPASLRIPHSVRRRTDGPVPSARRLRPCVPGASRWSARERREADLFMADLLGDAPRLGYGEQQAQVCGFFRPDGTVRTMAQVRGAIVARCNAEWSAWHTGVTPKPECDVTMFGRLIGYYLAANRDIFPDSLTEHSGQRAGHQLRAAAGGDADRRIRTLLAGGRAGRDRERHHRRRHVAGPGRPRQPGRFQGLERRFRLGLREGGCDLRGDRGGDDPRAHARRTRPTAALAVIHSCRIRGPRPR